MARFSRSSALPEPVRARVPLQPGDTVLAAVALTDGRWAAVTRTALVVLDDEHVVRTTWAQIERASLDGETGTLTVHWVTGATRDLLLGSGTAAATFARALRERVQRSVVHTVRAEVPGGQVQVVVRRDEQDALFTQVLALGEPDVRSPQVSAVIDAALARARDAVGLRD